jgi:N-acetylmuramoyl-L-alanine amidase
LGALNVNLHFLPYQQALAAREITRIDLLVIHCTELPDLATAREYGERLLYPATASGSDAANRAANRVANNSAENSGTGNSGHFYIDRNGSIEQWVPLDRTAHHVRGFNERSVGIELVNMGRYPNWLHSGHQRMRERYPAEQIRALLDLITELRRVLPGLSWIAGHAELDQELVAASDDASTQVHRKLDPGPCFPWVEVLADCGLLPVPR